MQSKFPFRDLHAEARDLKTLNASTITVSRRAKNFFAPHKENKRFEGFARDILLYWTLWVKCCSSKHKTTENYC